MYSFRCVRKPFHLALTFALCALIATPSPTLWAAESVTLKQGRMNNYNLNDARITLDAGESRLVGTLSTAAEEAFFRSLIKANATTGFIDDEQDFLEYWAAHKSEILKLPRLTGQGPLTWQGFLADAYTRYKIDKSDGIEGVVGWLTSVVNNPYVEWGSWKTWAYATGALLFVSGVLKGALIAGPTAGAINAAINPIMTPINQKLAVKGNKYLGPVGMKLNSWLFDGKDTKTQSVEAKEAVSGLRALIEGRSYSISETSWGSGMKSLYQYWNNLNFLYSLVPDAYKGGRDRMADFAIRYPRDFAQGATVAISAAETQRQGAEGILDRMIAKGANAQSVESLGQTLASQIEQQMKIELDHPEKATAMQVDIDRAQAQFVQLGATTEQAARYVENTRKVFVFQRQAASMLAGQLIHDMMYSDTIKGAEKVYNDFLRTTGLDYMHAAMKDSVSEILNRLEFKVEVKASAAAMASEAPAPAKASESSSSPAEKSALEKVMQINKATKAPVLVQPGSLMKAEPETASQRVKEAVGRASRR